MSRSSRWEGSVRYSPQCSTQQHHYYGLRLCRSHLRGFFSARRTSCSSPANHPSNIFGRTSTLQRCTFLPKCLLILIRSEAVLRRDFEDERERTNCPISSRPTGT